jgi:hypothetical protein
MNENKGNNQQPVAGWVFKPGSAPLQSIPEQQVEPSPPKLSMSSSNEVSWSASEYIANQKNTAWFVNLGIVSVVLTAVIFLLTRDIVSVISIATLGIIVGVFAARQPHQLNYALDASGVHMGTKFYPYGTFKSFSVVPEGTFSHISLLPLKRFMPPIAIHFALEDEEKVINAIGDYLPYEEHKRDIVESFSHRVKF